MKTDMNEHTKQYRLIDGHRVVISFSKDTNTDLFGNIRDILLTCADTSYICRSDQSVDKMRVSKKEAS